jgi:hypothetical protein
MLEQIGSQIALLDKFNKKKFLQLLQQSKIGILQVLMHFADDSSMDCTIFYFSYIRICGKIFFIYEIFASLCIVMHVLSLYQTLPNFLS